MAHEVGLTGLGDRVETLAQMLARAERKALVWPGEVSRRTRAYRDARDTLKGYGAEIAAEPQELAERARLIVVASGARRLRSVAARLGEHLQGHHRIVHTAHGLEPETGLRGSEVLLEETPTRQVGALVGPTWSSAHLAGKPTAAVVSSRFPAVIAEVQGAFGGPMSRVYGNPDLVGVEVAGATADLIAVAVGIGDALDLGEGLRGTIFARGLAEMGRLGVALGGQQQTASGMAGLGYLIAQTSGEGRDPYKAGRALASGKKLGDMEALFGDRVEELAMSGAAVLARAEGKRVEAHITAQVHRLLTGEGTAAEALLSLLSLSQMME